MDQQQDWTVHYKTNSPVTVNRNNRLIAGQITGYRSPHIPDPHIIVKYKKTGHQEPGLIVITDPDSIVEPTDVTQARFDFGKNAQRAFVKKYFVPLRNFLSVEKLYKIYTKLYKSRTQLSKFGALQPTNLNVYFAREQPFRSVNEINRFDIVRYTPVRERRSRSFVIERKFWLPEDPTIPHYKKTLNVDLSPYIPNNQQLGIMGNIHNVPWYQLKRYVPGT